MTDTVEAAFEKQLTKWAMFDPEGKPLDPARVDEDPNGNFTLREETHVGALTQPPELANGKQNRFLTFCGQTVSVTSILSTRGRKAPDCQICRTHWEKIPEGERLKQA